MATHQPVMVQEVLRFLNPRPGMTIVDCTIGSGGHTEAILEQMKNQGRVIGIDQDPEALARAKKRLSGKPVDFFHADFLELEVILDKAGIGKAQGFLFDLGVSSEQLDTAQRGFSFQQDGPLDMRMNQDSPTSAADLINRLSEEKLIRLFREGGEERWAGRLARHILRSRQKSQIKTTLQLAAIVTAAIPARDRPGRIHPATKAFQALRFAVNGEIESLAAALPAAVHRSQCGSNVVVLSYESRSDGVTKGTYRHLARSCRCPPFLPLCSCEGRPLVKLLTRKPLSPSPTEIARNPRARSAKLRAAQVL